MKTFLIALLFLSSSAFADELSVDINLAARHFNREDVDNHNLNENNIGFGITHTEGDFLQTFGAYKNSINRVSSYGLLGYYIVNNAMLRTGILVGIVTGYKSDIATGAFATLLFKKNNINFIAVPPATKSTWGDGFIALQLQYIL
jgi:hypothetical protein